MRRLLCWSCLAAVWSVFGACLAGAAERAADEDLSPVEQQLERAMRAAHAQAVAGIVAVLADYRRRGVSPAFRDRPRRLGRELRELERTSWSVPYLSARKMQDGDIGILPGGLAIGSPETTGEWWRVIQVVGERAMLVENVSDGWQNPNTYQWIPSPDAPLYVYGVDTSGIVDGKAVHLGQLFICRGTETYQMLLGPRTVYRVEPFAIADPGKLLEKLRRRARSGRKSSPQVAAD